MVRLIPFPSQTSDHFCSLPLAIGLFLSVSALVALCAKQARKASKSSKHIKNESKMLSRSLSDLLKHDPASDSKVEEGFGEGGLWQKAILMGEKCQPPEFSGVIYYDCHGNKLDELPPRSPRASPLHSFSFNVPTSSS